MASPKNGNEHKDPYRIIGYMTYPDNRSIISYLVMEDPQSGTQFTATMCEALNMVQNGKAAIPKIDASIATR